MAKRRKKSAKRAAPKRAASKRVAATRATPAATQSSLAQMAQHAVLSQSDKIVAAATKRYKQLVRRAAKATNDKNKRKYLAAALSAVVIAGVVANDLKRRMDKQPATSARRKKRA
jgi:hypothetical protein